MTRTAPALTLAGIAALLASACCVAPLVLAIAGISGAWIARLRTMEPYSDALTLLAVAALVLAGWRIYRPSCTKAGLATRSWFWVLAALALLPVLVRLAAPLFYE